MLATGGEKIAIREYFESINLREAPVAVRYWLALTEGRSKRPSEEQLVASIHQWSGTCNRPDGSFRSSAFDLVGVLIVWSYTGFRGGRYFIRYSVACDPINFRTDGVGEKTSVAGAQQEYSAHLQLLAAKLFDRNH